MEDKIILKGEYLTDEEWFNCIKNIIRMKKIKNLFKL